MADLETKDDDGMTNGVPTPVFEAIDAVRKANQDDSDYEESDDDVTEDDGTTKDSTNDSTDTNTADGGDDAGDDEGIEVLGWDAATVQQLNKIDPNLVLDVKALLERESVKKSSADDNSLTPKKIEKVEDIGQITDEQLEALEKENPAMAAIVKNLNATVGKLSTALISVTEDENKRAEKAEKEGHYRNFCAANKRMDELQKDFPVFGSYDKLPKNEDGVPDERHRSVRERVEVWNKANALNKTGLFGSFEESLDSAIILYQGKNSENLALRKVATELKGRARKFTSRPTNTKTVEKTPKKGTDSFMKKVVGDALKQAGVKV